MKQTVYMILLCVLASLATGCDDAKSVRHFPHIGNTPYQVDSILITYANNPERALKLLDSAVMLGNISEYRGKVIRAKIYSQSLKEQRQDSAILICQALLSHDSVRNEPAEQESILDLLIAVSRGKHDFEQYMRWATQKAELCQQQGEVTEHWRMEAEIGMLMTHLGQVDEGLKKLDETISHLDSPGSIDRMDAFIIAVKRKISVLNDLERYAEVIPLAQRTLDRLDHYEQHPKDYAEDSYRLSWSDNPSDRNRYLDFSRAQAWGFMAHAHALLSEEGEVNSEKNLRPAGNKQSQAADAQKAREYLFLFDNSNYGKTFSARRMIAPAQMELGMYDEALATYDEVERRMAGDTLNEDYAIILRSRAKAAHAKGRIAEAYDFQKRYAALFKVVSDSLHRSEAHDYAARYHAQEQQLMIQENEAEAERSRIVSIAIAVVAMLAIAFALYFFRQKRIVSEKNQALVRMINSTPSEPKEMLGEEERKEERKENAQQMFGIIDSTIRSERLYANTALQRQDICERFGISRHTLNELFSQHTDGLSFPQYINNIRLREALHLLSEKPDMTLTAIASEVGFTPANLREQFKQKYGMSPAEYRQNL